LSNCIAFLENLNHKKSLILGFAIYSVEDLDTTNFPLVENCETLQKIPIKTTNYQLQPLRKAYSRIIVKPGTYVIIPSMIRENTEADFLLRIFSEASNSKTAVYNCTLDNR
jgi:hypothetical protein